MNHQVGSTARLIESAKTLARHGTAVSVVCNDETHKKVMQTNYPEIPNFEYILWEQVPDRSFQTMLYSDRQLYFDHYTVEQRLGLLIEQYEVFTKRRTCDL